MWYEAWCKAVEAARDGLTATLIIKHPKSGRLYVNFDPEILQLIRRDKPRKFLSVVGVGCRFAASRVFSCVQ